MDKTVVLVTGSEKRAMVREAIGVLGTRFKEKVLASKRILVHPNLVNFHNPSACSSSELIRGVVDHIALHTDQEILVADAGFHNTKEAFEKLDYTSLSRSGNITLFDLNDDETIEAFAYTKDLTKLPIGFSKKIAGADFTIVAVPAKMHSYYTVTLSLKTHIVGSLVVKRSPFGIHARWPWLHTGYKPAHMTLTELYLQYPADCALIDGMQAMEGNGPSSGTEVNLGWMIASFNPIAADALAAYLMGFDPTTEIGYLHMLDEKGEGPIDPKDMEIVGPDPKLLRRDLKKPDSWPGILGWR